MIIEEDEASRKNQRKELFYSFEVLDENDQHFGYIGDLTLTGLKIICKNSFKPNEHHQLKIKLPGQISDKQELVVEAKCMWCKKTDDAYQIGFKTEYDNQESIKIIKTIMELLALPDDLII